MLNKLEKGLTHAENAVNGFLILAGVLVLFVNIIARVFHNASSWAEEAIRYAIIWVTFFGGSQCAKAGNHVGIDLVIQVLPQNIQHIFYALAQFVAAIFCGFCTWAGWEATQLVIQTSQKSIAMLMTMWIVYISVPLGCLLMAIRFLVAGINYLRNTNNSSLILDEEGNVDLNKL